MTLNVRVEDVPFAILEMVKARILAQRQKQQQAKPTAPKGPRPQFRRFGASSKAYRMPRPAALPDDDVTSLGHLLYSSQIQTEAKPALTLVNNQIYETQIGITQSFGWIVTSGDRLKSVAYSINLPQPAFPSGPIAHNTTVAPETRIASLLTQTERVYRAGTAANGYFEQEYGYIYSKEVSVPGSLSQAQFDDVVSQLGGPFPTFQEQFSALLAGAPPLPPGHIYSSVYVDIIETVTTSCQVNILGSAIYTTSWTSQALTTFASTYGSDYFVIPVESDVCVLVVMARYAHIYQKALFSNSFTSSSPVVSFPYVVPSSQPAPSSVTTISQFASVQNKVYICSTEDVREVPIPAKLQSVLSILNPPMQYDGSIPIAGGPESLNNSSVGFASSVYPTWTPSVFAAMQSIYAFADSSMLQAFSSELNPLLADAREGFFADSLTDSSHYYAEWTGDRDNIDLNQFQFYDRQDDRTFSLPSQADSSLPGLNICWDWDDPDYCRTMCAALGFTDADLTP